MSSVSEYEYIKIVATIEAQFDDGFNCFKCLKRFDKYKESEKKDLQTKGWKKAKGCFDIRTRKYILGGDPAQRLIKYLGCPGNYTTLSLNYYIDLFFQFEKCVLPFEGKLSDQPSKIIEVFQVIEDRIARKNKEKLERESRAK